MTLAEIEQRCKIAELGDTGITLTAAELRYLLNLIERPVITTPMLLGLTRPDCPYCRTPLTGEIAHNRTTCPGCKRGVGLKWLGNTLVVTR